MKFDHFSQISQKFTNDERKNIIFVAFAAGNIIYFAFFIVLCKNELVKVVILNSGVNPGFEKVPIFEKINE